MSLTGGGSDGWDIFYKARQLVASGVPVVELTIGEHDTGTDLAILDAMHQAALGGHTGYAGVQGTPRLRALVAQRAQERTGVPTTADNVLITPGGQAALFAAHLALCDKGDRALYLDPYYATYPGTIRGSGATPVAVRTCAENGFQPRPADIAAQAAGATSLLINSPNNPTGAVYDRNTLQGIAQVCHDYDLWLVSDEVYETQVWEGCHQSARALPGMENRTLVVGSMSKSHAMTGSRIGWIIAPKEVVRHLRILATHNTYGVAGFVQDAAAFALQQGAAFEAQIAAPFRRRRAIVQRVFAGQNLVRVLAGQGAMYVMLDLRATGLSGEAFATRLLEEHRIAVMPGESFGTAAAGHVRIALTVADAALAQALTTLRDFATTIAAKRAGVLSPALALARP